MQVINPSYLSLSPYSWQTTGNVLAMISSLIAAGLYGNIGVKVLYNNMLVDFLKAPPLTSKRGKWIYAGVIPIYWTIAFIIAAAVRIVQKLNIDRVPSLWTELIIIADPQLHWSYVCRGCALHPAFHVHFPADALHWVPAEM